MREIIISYYDSGCDWNVFISPISLILNDENYDEYTYDEKVDKLIQHVANKRVYDWNGYDNYFMILCDKILETEEFDRIVICCNGNIFIKEK